MKERISRKEFIGISLLASAGALLSVSEANSKEGGRLEENPNEKLWGTYRVGAAGLGEIQGIKKSEISDEIGSSILNISKQIGADHFKMQAVEVVGSEKSVIIPLSWTTEDGKVKNRWSIWSFNKEKEIVPVDIRKSQDIVFVEMSKLDAHNRLVIGPTSDYTVEPFISYVQNWGWEMRLPYKDLNKVQGPIPLKDTASDLREFLIK